jgi:K+-transporting ATPase KdpF subunit
LSALSAENLIGLIVGILLTVYLFVALVLPERF